MIIKITQLNGESFTIEISDGCNLSNIESKLPYSFEYIDLFYDDCCITTSYKIFTNVKLVNNMEIMMIVHDKSVRLLDNHILRNGNQSKWDIIRMEEIYGPIEEWDTSWITDMSYAFSLHFTFDRNISKWDISSVKNMEGMFFNAYSFSQDISNWNISNVKNLEGIFHNAFDFNSRYLPKWDNKPTYESILS